MFSPTSWKKKPSCEKFPQTKEIIFSSSYPPKNDPSALQNTPTPQGLAYTKTSLGLALLI